MAMLNNQRVLLHCYKPILHDLHPVFSPPALVDLLPEIACVSDDPYNSSPEEERISVHLGWVHEGPMGYMGISLGK